MHDLHIASLVFNSISTEQLSATITELSPVGLNISLQESLSARGGQATYFLNCGQLPRVQNLGGLPTPTLSYICIFKEKCSSCFLKLAKPIDKIIFPSYLFFKNTTQHGLQNVMAKNEEEENPWTIIKIKKIKSIYPITKKPTQTHTQTNQIFIQIWRKIW